MLPPLPRCSGWTSSSLIHSSHISLPRKGYRVGLHIVLFEVCSAFTHVAACTLALSPMRDTLSEGFSHFVTSIAAPVASGWSGCRAGLTPAGKRRLTTAHTLSGHCGPRSGMAKSRQERFTIPAARKRPAFALGVFPRWSSGWRGRKVFAVGRVKRELPSPDCGVSLFRNKAFQ